LVKLHKKYGDKIACVSLSAFYPADKVFDKSLKFLKDQEATFANFFLGTEEDEAMDKEFALDGVPAVFVYDSSGKLVDEFKNGLHFHDGKKVGPGDEHVYKEVNKIVEKLANQ
jgi:hypothetical protein